MIIKLKDIRAHTIIGLYDDERLNRQPILINLAITFDEGDSPKTDDIHDTLNYCELTKDIVERVNKTDFILLEKLVSFVADIIMEHPLVSRAEVEIDKIEVLKEYADSVSLTLTRIR